MWEAGSDGMSQALARHDEIIRGVLDERGGFEFALGGDGFALAFARARDAVRAAIDMQRALATEQWERGLELRVRMGVHTGDAVERDDNYFGSVVNRAARFMGAARGGQIVMSDTTAALLGTTTEWRLVDVGLRRLKGFADPSRIFSVQAEGLEPLDDPLRVALSGKVPRPPDEFIGRGRELDDLCTAVAAHRIVTLTGVGGVGKTRAAIEVATRVADRYADGVWFVELAPISEPSAVVHGVAATLGVHAQEGVPMVEAIVEWKVGRQLLVVLDNCEHVVDVSAELVTMLTAGSDETTILVTSREPLGVTGEYVHVVASLDPAVEAVELFESRARLANDQLKFDDDDRGVIREICGRLDGIPLAIELAAARSRSLTPTDVLARLQDRFRLLRGGARGVERHQTLRATVQWSYQLLSHDERLLFDRLSVFAGGFDLDAAERVSGHEPLDALDVVDHLGSLVDKSMVGAERVSGRIRYRLLETLRQFGEEQLDARGETAAAMDRHLAYYSELLTTAALELWTPAQAEVAAMLDCEWDNLRSAHAWAVASGYEDSAVAVVVGTQLFGGIWLRYEHEQWLAATIELLGDDHPAAGYLLAAASQWATQRGDQKTALELARRGLALARASTDPTPSPGLRHMSWVRLGEIMCLGGLATAYVNSGQPQQALEAAREAESLIAGDPLLDALTLTYRIWVAWAAEPSAVAGYARVQREIESMLPSPLMSANACFADGVRDLLADDAEGAYRAFHECLELTRDTRTVLEGQALQSLALAASLLNDERTEEVFRDALVQLYDTRYWMYVWIVLETLATYWVRRGRVELGAVLLGHLRGHEHSHATLLAERAEAFQRLENLNGAEQWLQRGESLDRDEIVAFALGNLESRLS